MKPLSRDNYFGRETGKERGRKRRERGKEWEIERRSENIDGKR
jgi:hypothetical protein